MEIHLYATFRLLAASKGLSLDAPAGTTVMELSRRVVNDLPVLQPHWFNAAGELHAHVHILVNGRDTTTMPLGLDTPLQPGDSIDFFPPVAGG
jgi:molybdopterin synthase sulfur carrier subunit